MGNLTRFNLGRIIKDFDTTYMFETGTLWGDGVAYALNSPFKKVISVEIVPEIADKARQRFVGNSRVEIIEGDSLSVLAEKLPLIKENIVFWLDAHFPGADAGLSEYDNNNNEDLRLPLLKEVEIIRQLRPANQDVFILDDMRIYEDGPYENGNVPPDALPKGTRSLNFIDERFPTSHMVFRSYLDEGYVLLFPKKKYKSAHFKWMDLFSKNVRPEDHYLAGQ